MTITVPKSNDNHEDDTSNSLMGSFDIDYSPTGSNEHRLADKPVGMGQETDEF